MKLEHLIRNSPLSITNMSNLPTLLVIGSGPGIAVSTATLFGKNRFTRIALLSRSESRLKVDKQTITKSLSSSSEVEIVTWNVDVTKSTDFKHVLREVEAWANGSLECVLYNSARVDSSTLTEFEETEIIYDFMVRSLWTYLCPLSLLGSSGS